MPKKTLIPLILTPFVLLAPVWLRGEALFWGLPATQFVPWWTWAFDTLLSGHLPLWNPLLGMGAPWIANYQSALFYPPYWLSLLAYALGGVRTLAWVQALIVALHLAWGGVGMAALIRRLGFGDLAQMVAGLAFGMSGYLTARGGFLSINAAAVWLPWILLFAHKTAARSASQTSTSRSQRATFLILAILIACQLLAGHAQLTWYTLLLTAAWVAFWAWISVHHVERGAHSAPPLAEAQTKPVRANPPLPKGNLLPRRLKALLRAGVSLALAEMLAAALAAVQLLPTAEYLLQSQRSSNVDYEIAMTYSLWPWRLLDFVAPGLFGSPATGDFWGYATYWEDALHIGLLPFLLAMGVLFGALFRGWRGQPAPVPDRPPRASHAALARSRPFTLFLLGVISVSFVLALGKNTPVFPWLYRNIPTFAMFKSPTRYTIWAIFALALLAARGVDSWRRPTGRGLYWTRLATMGAFAVTLGAGLGWFALRDLPDFHLSFVRALALAGAFGLITGALALLAPSPETSPRWGRAWSWAVTLFVAADLLITAWGLNPGIALDFYTQPPPNLADLRAALSGDAGQPRAAATAGRVYLPPSDEDAIKYARYFVFETFDPGLDWRTLRATFLPNLNLLDEIPYVNNYDPMLPGRYARWMEWLDGEAALPPAILDLMGVTVFEREQAEAEFGVTFTRRGGAAASRVRWLPCAQIATDAASAWGLTTSGAVDLRAVVILENASPPQISGCDPLAGAASLQAGEENPNRVLIRTKAEQPGWALLADTWYPGWQARVDGRRVLILRADYLFRAVEVPAGEHAVEFVYRPLSFWLGAGISLLALLGVAAVGVRSRKPVV